LGAIGLVELDAIEDLPGLKSRLLERNIWIRPFRNVVYLTPALTISAGELSRLTEGIYAVLSER